LEVEPLPHAQTRKTKFTNLFFAGKLPAHMGFDYSYDHIDNAATIPQSLLSRREGCLSSVGATLRMICDFSEEGRYANIAGGATGLRYLGYYTVGLKEWEAGEYFELRA
jgi:hypothetical protein